MLWPLESSAELGFSRILKSSACPWLPASLPLPRPVIPQERLP